MSDSHPCFLAAGPRAVLIACLLGLGLSLAYPVTALAIGPEGQRFFEHHCLACHGPDKQKGGLRVDELKWEPGDAQALEVWQEVFDRIDLEEMPPEDEPQPAAEERARFLSQLQTSLSGAAVEHGAEQVVLRRLNRPQYRNTIRDLLGIEVLVQDPTEAFPADDLHEGFDNQASTLQMSDFLLRQYLKVARAVVDRAIFEGEEVPEVETFRLRGDSKSRPLNYRLQGSDPDRSYAVLSKNDERAPGDPRGQSLMNCRDGAKHDGWYEFTFEVESKGRGNLAEELRVQRRKDYPVYRAEDLHRLEIYITAPAKASGVQTRPRWLVDSLDLPDNERVVIQRRYWLPKAWRLEVGFGNGYHGVVDLLEIVNPDFDFEAFRELPKREQNDSYGKHLVDGLEAMDAPRIVVHRVVETGPHFEQWPPLSHRRVLGEAGQSAESVIRAFAQRAFRRPVRDEELAPFFRLAAESPEGLRTAIEAILCSPRFLYLREEEGELDDYALASRLSYFLWNSMPDERLFELAAAGTLRQPNTLVSEVDRLLDDPRSKAFSDSFVWGWLGLKNTVEMAPDPMKFYEYHRNRIPEAMIAETNTFFRHVLDEDLPISTFLDADFAFLNADLGRHYGLEGKVDTTALLQRVSLEGTPIRGGLLGQASVLTASANGVDTSPVVRGIWILENLMGTPPSPPPPEVEVAEPDARGDLTIRQLYAKHRTVESCNDCHKKIDPLGFALENFDAVGNWRTTYESGHQVDSSGRMPSGEAFEDISGLKEILLRDQELFARNLTRKLMTYATGREMEVSDRPEIDRIADGVRGGEQGLRDLVHEIVLSPVFLTK